MRAPGSLVIVEFARAAKQSKVGCGGTRWPDRRGRPPTGTGDGDFGPGTKCDSTVRRSLSPVTDQVEPSRGDKCPQVGGGDRCGEKVPLTIGATEPAQGFVLTRSLHALGEDLHAQVPTELDDSAHQLGCAVVVAQPSDE